MLNQVDFTGNFCRDFTFIIYHHNFIKAFLLSEKVFSFATKLVSFIIDFLWLLHTGWKL